MKRLVLMGSLALGLALTATTLKGDKVCAQDSEACYARYYGATEAADTNWVNCYVAAAILVQQGAITQEFHNNTAIPACNTAKQNEYNEATDNLLACTM